MDYISPLQNEYNDDHDDKYQKQSSYSSARKRPHSDHLRNNQRPNTSTGGTSSSSNEVVAKYSSRYRPTGYPKELTSQFGAQQCKLCAVELSSPIVAKMHYSGKQHLKKQKRFLLEWSLKTGLPIPEENSHQEANASTFDDYCDICEVRLISNSEKISHYSGKSHRKNERDPDNAKRRKKVIETMDVNGRFGIGEGFSSVVPDENPILDMEIPKEGFTCDICDVKAINQEQLDQHLSGKKHKQKLEKQENKKCEFSCRVCDLHFDSHQNLQIHLEGKRHIKNVSKLKEELT